jgi:hypothetical protein
MKAKVFWRWGLGLVLAALPFVSGCDQMSASSTPVINSNTNQAPAAETATTTNEPPPEMAAPDLETAPGEVVSPATVSPQSVHLTGPAAEIVKLTRAGVDESVMLAFVTNSPNTFNLTSDGVIYLNDIGVPDMIVRSMIQHDQMLKEISLNSTPSPAPPVYPNQPAPAPYPTQDPVPVTTEAQPSPAEDADNSPPPEQVNVSAAYFVDSLAPYGSWINVGGYGMCWQPTVVVANPGWRPYCDRGRWVYTDCGWYWRSDYSWGWAPFHYGRWFQHQRWGWCWTPGTVWGPSWVSWRYTPGYCGWAPLPPAACYRAGGGFTYHGRHAGFGFGFGLGPDSYSFVPANRFCDPHPWRHRVAPRDAAQFYHRTVPVNQFAEDRNHRVVNKGIPVKHIAASTGLEMRPVRLQDGPDWRSAGIERQGQEGRSLTVYRPNLLSPPPGPRPPGEGIRPQPGTHDFARPGGSPVAHTFQPPAGSGSTMVREPRRDSVPVTAGQPHNSMRMGSPPDRSGQDASTVAPIGAPPPLTPIRPGRTTPARNGRTDTLPGSPRPALNPAAQPAAPVQPEVPAQNNRRIIVTRDQRQFTPPPQTPAPAPTGNRVEQPSPRGIRQEAPKFLHQDQRAFPQSAAPAQNRPVVQPQPSPSIPATVRQHQGFNHPAPQREAPSFHSTPAMSATPRVQTHPAPPVQAPPPAAPPNRAGNPALRSDRQSR